MRMSEDYNREYTSKMRLGFNPRMRTGQYMGFKKITRHSVMVSAAHDQQRQSPE
jgi:hypothetical protein